MIISRGITKIPSNVAAAAVRSHLGKWAITQQQNGCPWCNMDAAEEHGGVGCSFLAHSQQSLILTLSKTHDAQ